MNHSLRLHVWTFFWELTQAYRKVQVFFNSTEKGGSQLFGFETTTSPNNKKKKNERHMNENDLCFR